MNVTLSVTPAEARALQVCIENYLDNEHDKGPEGIGTDLANQLDAVLGMLHTGQVENLLIGGQYARSINLTSLQFALAAQALEVHATGDMDETCEEEGLDAGITAVLARVHAASINI